MRSDCIICVHKLTILLQSFLYRPKKWFLDKGIVGKKIQKPLGGGKLNVKMM